MGIERMQVGLESIRSGTYAPISTSSPPAIAIMLTPVIHDLWSMEGSEIRLFSEEDPNSSTFRRFDIAIVYAKQTFQHADLESLGTDVYTPVSRPDIAEKLKSEQDFAKTTLLVNDAAPVSWDD